MRKLVQDLLTTLVLFLLSYDFYTKEMIPTSIMMLVIGFLSLHLLCLDVYDHFRPDEFAEEEEE